MNGAFLHLAVNHIPVVGLPVCFLLLLVGLIRKSRDLVGAAFVGLILVTLFTMAAFKTGGPAARLVRNLPGIEGPDIRMHAQAAHIGYRGAATLGILGIIGLWLLARRPDIPTGLSVLVLLGALVASGWMAYVAHLGGEIRHPEIEESAPPPPAR
jgi:hypothetical protein